MSVPVVDCLLITRNYRMDYQRNSYIPIIEFDSLFSSDTEKYEANTVLMI